MATAILASGHGAGCSDGGTGEATPSGQAGTERVEDPATRQDTGQGGMPGVGGTGSSGEECIQAYGGAYCGTNTAEAPESGTPCRPDGETVCVYMDGDDWGAWGGGPSGPRRLSVCSNGQWETLEEDSDCEPPPGATCCNAWAVKEGYCCDGKGAYCESDGRAPRDVVLAVCDGTRWHVVN